METIEVRISAEPGSVISIDVKSPIKETARGQLNKFAVTGRFTAESAEACRKAMNRMIGVA